MCRSRFLLRIARKYDMLIIYLKKRRRPLGSAPKLEETMKKLTSILLAAALCAAALAGCSENGADSASASTSGSASTSASSPVSGSGSEETAEPHEPGLFVDGEELDADPVMTIDGQDISLDRYRFYYLQAVTMFGGADGEMFTGDQAQEAADYVKKSAEHNVKLGVIYEDIAQENNITLSDENRKLIDDALAQTKEQMGEDALQETLEYYGGEENYRAVLENLQLQQQVLAEVYGDQILQNVKDNYVHVKHILIPFAEETADSASASGSESAAPADHSAEQAKAQEVLDKLEAGEDFDALREEYSEDPGQPEEGYTFTTGYMVKPFEDAAFALKEGEISGLVETDYGYHIIQRLPIDEAYIMENLSQYIDSNMNSVISEDIQARMDALEITYCDNYDKIAPDTLF